MSGKVWKSSEKWGNVGKSGQKYDKLEKVAKMPKSGEKWWKVVKSWKKWGKVVKSGDKWRKVGISGESWRKVAKSGEKWRKVWKSAVGSPICAKSNRVLPLCVINGYAKYEVDRWICDTVRDATSFLIIFIQNGRQRPFCFFRLMTKIIGFL